MSLAFNEDVLRERLRATGLLDAELDEFVAYAREAHEELARIRATGQCACGGNVSRAKDERQLGARHPDDEGKVWFNYRCDGCSFATDALEQPDEGWS